MATEPTTVHAIRERALTGGLDRVRRLYGSPWLFAAVLAVMAGDVATTVVGLELGLHEVNPAVAAAIQEFGVIAMIGLKLVAMLVLLVFPLWTSKPRLTFRLSCACYVLVGFAAVVSNLHHIRMVL